MISHFNKDIENFNSIFIRLKHMLINKPDNKEFPMQGLVCTIL
jgi:hypothetical protein